MHAFDFGTEELRMLWASVVLGLVQVTLAVLFSAASGRAAWALGSRDAEGPPLGKVAARFERAWQNYLQTFPLFAAVVLLANALDRHGHMMTLGADLYFYGRLAYLPIYALGIPGLRTLAWSVSVVGIVLIIIGIWPGNAL
jgi:uncharacterized MAPEG superfamily protein